MNGYNLKTPASPPPIPPSAGGPAPSPRGNRAREFGRTLLFGCALLVCLLLAVFGGIYWNDTLVSLWIPLGAAFFLSIPLSLFGCRVWKFLSGYRNKWVNMALSVATTTGILYFLILFLNYKGADFSHADTQQVEVVKKYTETHTRSRGRRNHSVEKYNTWHYVFRLPDGRTKEVQVSLEAYNRIRTGSHYEIQTARGLFGMDVFRDK